MKVKDILKIVNEAFDETVSSNAFESVLGLESEIEGKEDFFISLECKLKDLFEEDLTRF